MVLASKTYIKLILTKYRGKKKNPQFTEIFLIKPCPEGTDKRDRASCDYWWAESYTHSFVAGKQEWSRKHPELWSSVCFTNYIIENWVCGWSGGTTDQSELFASSPISISYEGNNSTSLWQWVLQLSLRTNFFWKQSWRPSSSCIIAKVKHKIREKSYTTSNERKVWY